MVGRNIGKTMNYLYIGMANGNIILMENVFNVKLELIQKVKVQKNVKNVKMERIHSQEHQNVKYVKKVVKEIV